jgi:hypothetical protein
VCWCQTDEDIPIINEQENLVNHTAYFRYKHTHTRDGSVPDFRRENAELHDKLDCEAE